MTESPLVDSSLAIPIFSPRYDPIACLNKAIAFLTVIASSRFPSTNNQLRTSSNLKNQDTIQDGWVRVQQVQRIQGGQARVVNCYNCQGEGHMDRQCTQPKRPRNVAWSKDIAMLAEAQEAGQILDKEQLAFLVDPGVIDGQAVQTIIPNNAAFQSEDLDSYDSYCDDISNAKAVLMYNISNYGSDVISVDFRKRFVPEQELSAANAFWYHMLNPSTKTSDALPIKIEAPKELTKVSLVNESLKKLKLHLANFNKVVKIRTTPNARTEGEWSTDSFDQMDVVVQQSSFDKQCLKIAKKELLLEINRLLQQIMSQDVLLNVTKSMFLNDEAVNMERKRNESCDTKATPTLRLRSPRVRRQQEKVVGFEDAPKREGNKRGRNAEGIRHLEIKAREGENRGANLPILLAAHLGRNENSQPLRSSLTSVQGGHQPSTSVRGNLPPNDSLLSHHAQTFITSSFHIPTRLTLSMLTPTLNHLRTLSMNKL
nr:hypothetical protein [Tanacetum cinerariifolium]